MRRDLGTSTPLGQTAAGLVKLRRDPRQQHTRMTRKQTRIAAVRTAMSRMPLRVEATNDRKPTANAAAAPERFSERLRVPRHASPARGRDDDASVAASHMVAYCIGRCMHARMCSLHVCTHVCARTHAGMQALLSVCLRPPSWRLRLEPMVPFCSAVCGLASWPPRRGSRAAIDRARGACGPCTLW